MPKYTFGDPEQMVAIANDENKVARADTKALYTAADAEGDAPIMAQMPEGGAEFLTEMDGHVAVYNPNNGQIFDVATDEYEPIQPPQFLGPLAHELKERGREIEGTYHMTDGGGRGFLEALVGDDHGIWPEDRTGRQNPVRSGVSVSWSHDGGVSVKASAFAQDGACENTMRSVSDAIYVKHAGDVGERVDWQAEWESALDSLGTFSEALESVIEDALEYTLFDFGHGDGLLDRLDAVGEDYGADWVDATDRQRALEDESHDDYVHTPDHLTDRDKLAINGVFDLLGFPMYVSRHATRRLLWRMLQGEDPYVVSAWDAYSATTYALSHQAQFTAGGGQDRDYHRTASDVLSNPPMAEQDVEAALRRRLAEDSDEDVLIEEDLGDAARTFKQREDELADAFGD